MRTDKEKEIVFVAGLGSTGSSALVDLLKEVETYFVLDNEFRLFVDPGGLINLRDSLVENWSVFQSDIAIKNFNKMIKSLSSKWRSPNSHIDHTKFLDKEFLNLSKKYINSLTDIDYNGLWYGIDNIWLRQINKIPFIYDSRIFSKKMYIGKKLNEDDFNSLTNNYIKSMIEYCLLKNHKKHFCFNENLSCMFPKKILDMVPNSKIINIVRDPKDVYADSLRVNWLAIPKDKKKYIKWQLSVYNGWMEVEDKARIWDPNSSKLKVIKFEDFIFDYNRTIKSVFDFLNIDKKNHTMKRKFLDPSLSMKNVGQWKDMISKEDANMIDSQFEEFYKRYNY